MRFPIEVSSQRVGYSYRTAATPDFTLQTLNLPIFFFYLFESSQFRFENGQFNNTKRSTQWNRVKVTVEKPCGPKVKGSAATCANLPRTAFSEH